MAFERSMSHVDQLGHKQWRTQEKKRKLKFVEAKVAEMSIMGFHCCQVVVLARHLKPGSESLERIISLVTQRSGCTAPFAGQGEAGR